MTTNTATRSIARFRDLAELYAEMTASPDYRAAFQETVEAGRIGHVDDEPTSEMPDPLKAQLATEMLVRTLFDLLAGTRLERYADRLAWGLVHSFHKVVEGLVTQADEAAQEVRRLADTQDGSEVGSLELEEAQLRCGLLDEASDALACMRDHAAEVYRVETGRPWSSPRGSTVSSKRTASVIASADFLRARSQKRRDAHAPEGPVVVFSGGQAWHDHAQLYARLDEIRARVPHMVLATTAQVKGCDAIAAAWAAARGVHLVAFTLNPSLGKRAAFKRNERLVNLKPVEAVVCQGSGVQSNLYQLLRAASIPCHAFRIDSQCAAPAPAA